MIRLRPHHVLCILTFSGAGYTPAFVENMADVVRRAGAGEPIEVIDGPDDICAPLDGTGDEHCANASVARRDRTALLALAEAGVPVSVRPLVLDAQAVVTLRTLFAGGAIRAACRGCEWNEMCSSIAAGGFAGVVLTP